MKTFLNPKSQLAFAMLLNPLKKITLTLAFAIVFFASDAVANPICDGKTVYVQLPSDWENTVYIHDGGTGSFIATNGTTSGYLWFVFTLPDNGVTFSSPSFALVNTNSFANSVWIGSTYYGSSSSNNISINCTAFGSSNVIYIYEDPTNPGRTIVDDSPPNAKYLYFLPPLSQNWVEEIPYIMDASGERKPMSIDASRCGWYKAIYFEEDPPSAMMIGLGPTLKDPVGGGVIDLARKFDSLANNVIFYIASDNKWLISDAGIQQETQRCSYKMAALIYDTDSYVNTSFFDEGSGSGIAKGIPKNELEYNESEGKYKMVFNQAKDGWTKTNFEKAFDPNSKDNVVRCYEMPFGRDNDGLWEFNSNKLCADGSVNLLNGDCSDNGGYMGGFFPPELQTRGTTDYSQCSTCDTQRKAESWVPLNSTISQFCYDRGYRGTSGGPDISNCGTAFGEGDFINGDNPSIWNWGYRPYFGETSSTSSTKNQLFCFESHAKFKYDPAQEFFFSGDDDIWVFINNKLVIDLGGTHLAAPGYVKLSDLDLEEGETYPLDIFFCDRRTTMSNVRIASNIYFGQTAADGEEAGLFLQEDRTICLRQASNSCAALMGLESSTKNICGAELAPQISYILTISGLGEIPLNYNEDCEWITYTQGVCYGGILIDNGKVSIDEAAITDPLLKTQGFDIYASVYGYSPLNVSKAEPAPLPPNSGDLPPDDDGDNSSIITSLNSIIPTQEPVYYNLKGEPLGNKKPSKAGVYIMRLNGISKTIVVK